MKSKNTLSKNLALVTELGVLIILSILAGLLLGKILDNIAGTRDIYTLIFLPIGVIAGYEMLFLVGKRCSESVEEDF